MKIKASEVKVGQQLVRPDVPEQRLFVSAKDDGIITLIREGKFDLVPARFYEAEFDAVGFEVIR